jgi:DNA-binding Xre family transcriptional regulator
VIKISTDYQVIEHNGSPVAVIVPCADFLEMSGQQGNDNETLPHEVVKAMVDGHTTIAAWRKYSGYDQQYMADQIGVNQPAYSQMEAREFFNRRKTNRDKLCHILNVKPAQLLDIEAQKELPL